MEGSRGFGELLTSTSLFSSNDIIFNEIVEVELEKRSGSIHKGEGGEEGKGAEEGQEEKPEDNEEEKKDEEDEMAEKEGEEDG